MDFAISIRAAKDKTRWKGVVGQSFMITQRHYNVMGKTRLDICLAMPRYILPLFIDRSEFTYPAGTEY